MHISHSVFADTQIGFGHEITNSRQETKYTNVHATLPPISRKEALEKPGQQHNFEEVDMHLAVGTQRQERTAAGTRPDHEPAAASTQRQEATAGNQQKEPTAGTRMDEEPAASTRRAEEQFFF